MRTKEIPNQQFTGNYLWKNTGLRVNIDEIDDAGYGIGTILDMGTWKPFGVYRVGIRSGGWIISSAEKLA